MLAIEVDYLLGRAVATDLSRRDFPEWPPHPSRLFSALVDALYDVDDEGERTSCESVLRWLEQQPAPEIAASMEDDLCIRTSVKYFVPINDEVADAKNMRASPLVDIRTRQERFFPAAVPADSRVTFAWPASEPSDSQRGALSSLARRVPYLGHSSSLVRVSCPMTAPPRTLAPAEEGAHVLRVPGPGRLDRLNAVHEVRKANTLVQPPKGREIRYAPVRAFVARGTHGQARVFAFQGPRFGLEDTAWITDRYRAALLSKLPHAASELLTGHGAGGARASRAHLSFVPLANVQGQHADGSIKGLGVVIPRDASDEELIALETASMQVETLAFGARGVISLRPVAARDTERGGSSDRDALLSLRFSRYIGPSRTWASVTPVALGLHPKPRKGLSEEDVLRRDLADVGLPAPTEVALQDVAFVANAPPSREFKRGGVSALRGRLLRHVYVRFPEAVEGPLVVGAGRYMGFGLLLPAGGGR